MPPDPTPAPAPGPASAGLKLRARDDEDLQALAALLQDALVPLSDMLYEPELRRFALVVNRFMWEAPGTEAQAGTETRADGEGGEPVHARVHGVLAIHEVGAVSIRDIDRTHPDTPLCLLTLRREDGCLHLEFAGGGTIRIAVDGIHLYLEDVGEPWPTVWRPEHPEE